MTKEERIAKLIARIEVCDGLWRQMVGKKAGAKKAPKFDAHTELMDRMRVRGYEYMMEVVEEHRRVAQEALIALHGSEVGECERCKAPTLNGTCVVDGVSDLKDDQEIEIARIIAAEYQREKKGK